MRRLLLILLAAGCADFRDPGDLKYAQVLAVRLTPAQLRAGQRARLEVLATDNAGMPFEANPKEVAFAPDHTGKPLPLPPEANAFIEREGEMWYVRAPDEAQLDVIAAALGLMPGAALRVPLRLTVAVDAVDKRADKVVTVLRSPDVQPAGNPTIKEITLDGEPVDKQAQVTVGEHRLAVTADEASGTSPYAWYTGLGELKHYRMTGATLTIKEPATGVILIVVRNDRGGVGWRWFQAEAR